MSKKAGSMESPYSVESRAVGVDKWPEMAHLQANLLSRELMLNTDISTQHIVAPDGCTREPKFLRRGQVLQASTLSQSRSRQRVKMWKDSG